MDKWTLVCQLIFQVFFGGFIEELETPDLIPMLNELKTLRCKSCGYTFDDIASHGRLGCKDCYEVFEDRLDPLIRRIQGANRHVGRIGKVVDRKIEEKYHKQEEKQEIKKEVSELQKLQNKLKEAIQQEKYEEAATIRDEIKKLEK